MKYEFTLKKQGLKRIVLALTLDKKKLTERIIIGEPEQIKLRFEHESGNVYYDKTRPLGSLFVDFEKDINKDWNVNAMKLRETYSTLFILEQAKTKAVQPYIDFLKGKMKNGEPSAIFAAIHTWDEYINCYDLNHGADLFIERTSTLYRLFFRKDKIWEDESILNPVHPTDSQVELWYPAAKRPFECVVGFSSFTPLISYYLYKIKEWKYVFQKCKVCDRDFLARSRHYELCSDKCRKAKMSEAKKEFDERAKGDRLEVCCESAYYHWYNRYRKLKRDKSTDPDKLTAFETEFAYYRKEAKRRKDEVKRKNMELSYFTLWLENQKDIADTLM